MTGLLDAVPQVDLPEGRIGDWAVERFTVSEQDAAIYNINPASVGRRTMRPGTYTRLRRGTTVVMSDTHAERRDHAPVVLRAEGAVLVTGLGLGMVTAALLARPAVRRVDVIERSAEVLDLVGRTLAARYGDRLALYHASAYEWRPPAGARWDLAWHDIWDDICADNLPEMARLRRRFCRRVPPGRQFCWAEADCRAHGRRERRLDLAVRAARRIEELTGERPVIFNCDDAAVVVANGRPARAFR